MTNGVRRSGVICYILADTKLLPRDSNDIFTGVTLTDDARNAEQTWRVDVVTGLQALRPVGRVSLMHVRRNPIKSRR